MEHSALGIPTYHREGYTRASVTDLIMEPLALGEGWKVPVVRKSDTLKEGNTRASITNLDMEHPALGMTYLP